MKILVTGFTPFDGDSRNPSEELLGHLKGKTWPFELVTDLLPVSFSRSTKQIAMTIAREKPALVIMTGLAKNRSDITVERIGINWVDARIEDVDGEKPVNQKINLAGEDGLFTRLPVLAMIDASRAAGVPAKLSTSAGEYVCNYLLYRVLQENPQTPVGFIHLPWDANFSGVERMLEVCYHHLTMNK